MNQRRLHLLIGLATLLLVANWGERAHAGGGPWQKTEFVEARLVSAVEGTGDLRVVPLGIEVRLAEHWKTYWRSPGEAGLPPSVDWAGSTNLKSATLLYPLPARFTLFNHQTFGYTDTVVFPVHAEVAEAGAALAAVAKLDILVCEKICVPQTLDLTLAVPQGAALPGAEAQLVNRFESLVPATGPSAGLEIVRVTSILAGGKPALEIVAVVMGGVFSAPDVLVETEPAAAFGQPQVLLEDDGHRVVFTLPLIGTLPAGTSLDGRPVITTVSDGGQAIERKSAIFAGTAQSLSSTLTTSALMAGFALLGGLVLNLMPCVLPVLSLKLMSLVDHGDAPPAQVRLNFLATASGIVFSLLMIAAALIALKSAGLAVGWGIQFQQPVFVAAIAVVVALFACNMWGLFEVILPPSLSNFAGTAGGEGGGIVGNFVIGAFATLLATPCSAPFVGTAVGFALAGGPAQIVMIFLALGVGLALPYLAIAAFPSVARFIPKPGRWMERLRQILGLALAGTGLWLVSILPAQIGMTAALGVGVALVAMAFALVLRRLAPQSFDGLGWSAAALLAVVAVGLPAIVRPTSGHGPEAPASLDAIVWTEFNRDQIKSLVSQGKTVFVDVTAEWCVVCKSNKKLVITNAEVTRRLQAPVIAMRADWTSPDPKISAFLASFGRYGIPLNVVYGPAQPGGILLPELLTTDAVIAALDKATGRKDSAAVPSPRSGT